MSIFRKKNIILISSIICALSLISCKRTKAESVKASTDSKKIQITATFYPLYIILMNITEGIPDVQLSLIAPADTGCLHDYQLTTKDMKAIEDCDILVANGAGMEDFLDKAIEIKKDATIIASEGFELVEENPHVWVSTKGELWIVKKISEGLCKLDSKNAEVYKKNATEYSAKVQELAEKMHRQLKGIEGRKVITFHEAFPYFAQEFKLDTVAVIEREPGTEPSARELTDLISTIRSAGKDTMLFAEPQYSSLAAQVIASETGLAVQELDPAVTGTLHKDAWLMAMENNLEVLKKNIE